MPSESLHVQAATVHEITLDGNDVTALAEFVKYRELFKLLLERGVFTTTAGSVTMHFDSAGRLRKIDTTHTVSDNQVDFLSK